MQVASLQTMTEFGQAFHEYRPANSPGIPRSRHQQTADWL
jgi:hypothetical protein